MKLYIEPKAIVEMTYKDNLPKIPDIVYVIFYKSLFKKIEQNFEFEKIKFTRGDFYLEKNNRFGVVVNFGIGDSCSSMLAEELSILGVKKVVSIGLVGSLSESLIIGDKVLIESAFSQSNIGAIYDYKEEEIFTSRDQNEKIKEILDKDINNYLVKTFSVLTIYRETDDVIEKARRKGISVIEMEVFSLALIFLLRGVSFSAICCVSDTLSKKGWFFEDNRENILNSLEDIFLKVTKHFK